MSTGRSTFPVFGTEGVLVMADEPALAAAEAAVHQVLDEVDRACSRFRDDSDLERVNRSPGRPVPVSRCLVDATLVALAAARRTGGSVDPTVGQALVDLGYDRDFRSVTHRRSAGPVFTKVPGWQRVVVDTVASTIAIPAATRLDLGATAKAWAADRAAAAAADATGCGALVGLGGDLAMVGPAPAGGWAVQVSDWCGTPIDPAFETISVTGGGVATSSTTVRRWSVGDQDHHHIIDPSSASPAEVVWRTVTVCAGCCVDANVAATAAIVKGVAAVPWLQTTGLPARLVRPDGRILRVGGWPAVRAA